MCPTFLGQKQFVTAFNDPKPAGYAHPKTETTPLNKLQGRRLFNRVLSIEKTLLCMFQRLFIYFQDTGVLIFGGYVLSGHCSQQQISVKNERYLFSEGYLFTGVLRYLPERNTRICGTVRRNRKGLPGAVIRAKPQKGAFEHRRRGSLMVLKYNDKRPVLMMSSMHKAEMADTGKRDRHGAVIRKPSVICDYNKHMGGVDRNDELLGFYTSLRKTLKWYKKLAFHLTFFLPTFPCGNMI